MAHPYPRPAYPRPPYPRPEQAPRRLSTRSGYDRWAATYDGYDNPLIRLEEREFDAVAGDLAGLSVLDVGCGTGRRSIHAARAGARVTGIDFSAGMLAQARQNASGLAIDFLAHDIRQPFPFEAGTFDGVLCCLSLEHIEPIRPVIADMARVCRPGAFVLISELHPELIRNGVQARYRDPESGEKMEMESIHHPISAYLMAALAAGLELSFIGEHPMDAATAAGSRSSQKYVGLPMLLLMRFRRPAPEHCAAALTHVLGR